MSGYDSIAASLSSPELSKGMEKVLFNICNAIKSGNHVTLPEVRDALQRAAALLCSSNLVHATIAHYLVSLPFQIFSQESISIGISLWLGAMHENPRLEPTLLFAVVQEWEKTVLRRQGLFNPSFK